MDIDGEIKPMNQLSTVCGASIVNNQIIFSNLCDSHSNEHALSYMWGQYIQPSLLKSHNYGNVQPNDNGTNEKLKSLYNDVNSSWMIKYGMEKLVTHHMNTILVKSWDTFKVHVGNTNREIFL